MNGSSAMRYTTEDWLKSSPRLSEIGVCRWWEGRSGNVSPAEGSTEWSTHLTAHSRKEMQAAPPVAGKQPTDRRPSCPGHLPLIAGDKECQQWLSHQDPVAARISLWVGVRSDGKFGGVTLRSKPSVNMWHMHPLAPAPGRTQPPAPIRAKPGHPWLPVSPPPPPCQTLLEPPGWEGREDEV